MLYSRVAPFLALLALAQLTSVGVAQSLVRDLKTAQGLNVGSRPQPPLVVGKRAFFTADDGVHGPELWVTDGTATGTRLVRDITPGSTHSDAFPSLGASVNGRAFFYNTANGDRWFSDGTSAGTVRVDTLSPSLTGSSIRTLFLDGTSEIYFTATSNNKAELWRSNATRTGTQRVGPMPPGETLRFVARAGTTVYFLSARRELWFYKLGTTSTAPLRKVTASRGSFSNPTWITAFGARLLFVASNSLQGTELWSAIAGVATLAADVNPGKESGVKGPPFPCGATAYFAGTPGGTLVGTELMGYSGGASAFLIKDLFTGRSGSGQKQVPNSSSPRFLACVSKTPFFLATTKNGQRFFWGNGTMIASPLPSRVHGAATILFYQGSGELWGFSTKANSPKRLLTSAVGSTVQSMFSIGDRLYFTASDATAGRELWSTTVLGDAARVADIVPGSSTSRPNIHGSLGTRLLLTATDSRGSEPWITTHDSQGKPTGARIIRDIRLPDSSSRPRHLTRLGTDQVVFVADSNSRSRQLWRTDGTRTGTSIVTPPGTTAFTASSPMVSASSLVVFAGNSARGGIEPWVTDGSAKGTRQLRDVRSGTFGSFPANFTVSGDAVFFTANDGVVGTELWVTAGDTASTKRVRDIRSGTPSSFPRFLLPMKGGVVFSADDGTHGFELWQSDGTSSGTKLVADINPAKGVGSNPQWTTWAGGAYYFSANDGKLGFELWKWVPGKAPFLLFDINKGSGGSNPSYLTVVGDKLFFSAWTPASGTELCVWDTRSSRLTRLDLEAGSGSSSPWRFTRAGDALFFVAQTKKAGRELWISDGTTAGTRMTKDLLPGSPSGISGAPFAVGTGKRLVLFAGDDGSTGIELYCSDGTANGTRLLKELVKGPGSSSPSDFALAGSRILFSAVDPQKGRELFGVSLCDVGGVLVERIGIGCSGSNSKTPQIGVTGLPLLGGRVSVTAAGFNANAPALLGLGVQGANLPIGRGCSIYLVPYLILSTTTDRAGAVTLSGTIPNDVSLRCLESRVQWISADSSRQPITTSAVRVILNR